LITFLFPFGRHLLGLSQYRFLLSHYLAKDGAAFDGAGLDVDAAAQDDIKEDHEYGEPQEPFPFINNNSQHHDEDACEQEIPDPVPDLGGHVTFFVSINKKKTRDLFIS